MNSDVKGYGYQLVLASQSPRRRKILEDLGLEFVVAVPDIQESVSLGGSADTVTTNARIKAEWAIARYPSCRIITADTVVDFRGRCIEKPVSTSEAREFLRMFSGQDQTVYTGVGLYTPDAHLDIKVAESRVVFKELSDETICEYIERVNPLDKAGAYDIDQSGDLLISHIEGSRTNVMGLPAEVVSKWLGLLDRD